MKILIAAASFSPHLSGIQRHAFNVARCLLHAREISEVHLVVSPWQQNLAYTAGLHPDPRLSIHLADLKQGSVSRNLWYYNYLPKLAIQLNVDLVHLSYPVPINPSHFVCPVIATLHDLYPYEAPQNFGYLKVLFNRLVLRHCLINVDAIACVSEATRMQLKKLVAPRIWDKSLCVYNCVGQEPAYSASSPLPSRRNEPFLLSVAQHRHNKNIPLLIRTFDHMLHSGQLMADTQLVIIGISGPETPKILQLLSERHLKQQVHLLEGIIEAELQWCYRHCAALVAPSTTEGFGLPVAEAILAGCRVVCSDIPAHREIAEGLCHYVSLDGDAEKNLAAAISAALCQPAQEPIPLPQFSLPVLSKEYVDLYRGLISSAAMGQPFDRTTVTTEDEYGRV